jgi:hypothetical protein
MEKKIGVDKILSTPIFSINAAFLAAFVAVFFIYIFCLISSIINTNAYELSRLLALGANY